MTLIVFYVLAALAVLFASFVVFAKNPIHSALYLVVTFFAIAGQYILLNAQFLAIVHIIVYAGAIMVLLLFVLMLLNLDTDTEPQKSLMVKGMATVAAGMLMLTLVGALRGSVVFPATQDANASIGLVKTLGKVLFTDFLVPFEVASILFLAAMVGVVITGKRGNGADKEVIIKV